VVLLDELAQFRIAVNATFGGQLVIVELRLPLVVLDFDELGVALGAAFLAVDAHLCRVLEDLDDDVTTVADQTPLGN